MFIDDLVEAIVLTQENVNNVSGQAFNNVGGIRNSARFDCFT